MKTSKNFLFVLLSLGLFFQSCTKDNFGEVPLIKPVTVEPMDEAVVLGSVSINAFVKDVIEVTTGKPFDLEELLDEMVVQIMDDPNNGAIVFSSNYREISGPIPLAPGIYSLLISNYDFSPQRFDTPNHGVLNNYVSVTAGVNTPLDLELALLDVGATINFSGEVLAAFPDVSARVEYIQQGFGIGPNLTWTTADNTRSGYLNTYVGDFGFDYFYGTTGTLTIEITATGPSGLPLMVTKTYTDVFANQHYNIAIEQGAPTTASLIVSLGSETVIDDTVIFPY